MENKPKLNRAELLAKARAVKAEKQAARKAMQVEQEVDEIIVEAEKPVKVKKEKKVKPTTETKTFEANNKEDEVEVVNEVVRIPANKKKKVIKRTIEIEETESEEEIQEEIVKIPKMKKEVRISRDEMKAKLIESNKSRLLNELFS
jgi:hypothetical protein